MDDESIHDTIKRLVSEEHAIWETGAQSPADHGALAPGRRITRSVLGFVEAARGFA